MAGGDCRTGELPPVSTRRVVAHIPRMTTPRLTDEQARALWRRAAELQAAAERASSQQKALQPVDQGELSIEQVTAAAEGAGIDPEFVRIAVAERGLPDADALRHDDWRGRWLQRLMREPHVIEEERVIQATPAAVLSAFRSVAAAPSYQLMPERVVGEDPARDAVLVYRITKTDSFGSTLDFADARVLLVTIRPHERGAVLRLRVPLFRRGVNLFMTGLFATIFGGGGAGLAGGIAGTLGATALAFAAPVAAGVAAGGAVGVVAFRGIYRAVDRSARGVLRQLLNAVAVEAEGTSLMSGGGTP